MINHLHKSLFIILAFLAIGCQQKKSESTKKTEVYRTIDSLFQSQYKNGQLNGSILIIKNNNTIYEKSYGYSDSTKTTQLNSSFRFNIGSIYKEFPAVAIMQLKEKGHLNLDDRIQKYLPELPKWSNQILIKHLLQYTSGLPRVNWMKHENINGNDVYTDLLNLEELNSNPGEQYLYTNNSPYLLIKIIERITKMNFNSYVKQNVFIPYNLKDTSIKKSYPYNDRSLMAIPFDSNYQEDTFPIHISSILFCSTPKDMYSWFEQLNTFKIISEESLLILAQKSNVSGNNIQSPLGYTDIKDGKISEHSHHGSSGNYESLVRHYNVSDLTIIIMTNQKHNNLHYFTEQVEKIINR